jgi:LacI family trehalose operon transcriptional repressor
MKQGYETVASVLTAETSAGLRHRYPRPRRQQISAAAGPRHLQLASVGSTPLMKFLHPEILTVDPGYAESGRQAARQLIEQIAGSVNPVKSSFPPP